MGKGRSEASFLLAVAAALLVLIGCSGDNGGDKAHINAESGSTNGAIPDERLGTKPLPAKQIGLAEAAKKANCYLFRKVRPQEKFLSDPPLWGPHVAPPHQQSDGAYLTPPKRTAVVAALDHGRMAIQYAPDLAEEIQLELKGLYDTMYGGTLLLPNETMSYAVAATTWRNILGCTGYEGTKTLDAIRAFGKATWGKYGGVPVKKFPVEGPTPADPEESGNAASG